MSSRQVKVDLFPVDKKHFIPAIARTIHKSFSSDPLIQWLRPNAVPWIQQDSDTCRWQYRRIQRTILEGNVFTSASVRKMAIQYPERSPKQDSKNIDTTFAEDKESCPNLNNEIDSDDVGAVVFLFPPEQTAWTVSRLWLACKLWLLDHIAPAYDNGANEERVGILLDKHEASEEVLKKRFPRRLWYLEVIAVHPSLQSRGLGGGVMRWVLEHIHDEPVYLECTREENIGFYQSFGFEVSERVDLAEEGQDDVFNHWVMVHPGKS